MTKICEDIISVEEIRKLDSELATHEFFKDKNEVLISEIIKLLKFKGALKNENDETRKNYNRYRKTILNKEKRDKCLFADATFITEHIVKLIIKDCLKLKSQGAYLILLSLFTGRSIKDIQSKITINQKQIDNTIQIYYLYDFELRDYGLSSKIKKLIEPTLKRVSLTLPNEIFKRYGGLGHNGNFNESIDELIQKIKLKHGIKLGLNKIKQYMNYWMVNNGFDITEIEIIKGKFKDKESTKSNDMVVGIHYYQVKIERINKLYNKYVKHLLELVGFSYFEPKRLQTGYIGSNLTLKKKAVSNILNSIYSRIRNTSNKSLNDREEQFNLMVIYTLMILNLSTGHRPVDYPYQSLKLFNLDLKTVHISDKHIKNELPFRVSVLSNFAMKQMNVYLKFLKRFGEKNNFTMGGIQQELNEMLKGDKGIFRFIKNGEFIEMKNKVVKKKMEEIIPIKLNWHRHFIRSNLPNYGLSGQLIDMWMGHEGRGGTGFSSYSKMSLNDLSKVAKSIDELFLDLKLNNVQFNYE